MGDVGEGGGEDDGGRGEADEGVELRKVSGVGER